MESGTLNRLVPTGPAVLGAIRAALCGFVLVQILLTDFADLGRLPTTVMRPTGLMQLVPWSIYNTTITPNGMMTLKALLMISFIAATVGYSTSVATKFAALLFLFYQGILRSFGHFNHDEMPVVYILLILAFTPCANAFSVDALLRGAKRSAGALVYGYPILLMRLVVAWSYFSSAIIKMRVAGLSYFTPDNLPALGIWHSLDNLHDTHYRFAFLLPNFRGVTTAIVIMVVLWELVFPLAIFSKVARPIILTFGILFHVLTVFFMNISFPYHLAAYAVFVDWPKLATQIEKIPFLNDYLRRGRPLSVGLSASHSD